MPNAPSIRLLYWLCLFAIDNSRKVQISIQYSRVYLLSKNRFCYFPSREGRPLLASKSSRETSKIVCGSSHEKKKISDLSSWHSLHGTTLVATDLHPRAYATFYLKFFSYHYLGFRVVSSKVFRWVFCFCSDVNTQIWHRIWNATHRGCIWDVSSVVGN